MAAPILKRYPGPARATAIAALAALLLALASCNSKPANEARTQSVNIDGKPFVLDLALDDAARFKGLSDRTNIPADGGMLFVFPEAEVHDFVMRRCPNPIDILFLDPTGRVVMTHAMKPEPEGTREEDLLRYSSRWPVQFAIELRGGTLERLNLPKGAKIELPLAELKRRAR